MQKLKQIHLWFGLIGIILFILSGLYMHFQFSHLVGLEDGPRMLFRSAHIYFLLLSVINLLMGVYFEPRNKPVQHYIQFLVSTLMLIAPMFVIIGFFREPYLMDLMRPFTIIGIYAIFSVVVILTIYIIVQAWLTALKRRKNEI